MLKSLVLYACVERQIEHRPECHCFSRHVPTVAHFFTRGIVICMRRTSRRSLVNRLSSGNRKVSWQDSTARCQSNHSRCEAKSTVRYSCEWSFSFFDKFQKQTLTWPHTIAVNMNFIYISHHFTAREDMNSTN